jgi:hypothetical protein
MMACFGGIAHAPLAMMLMVAEMTGNLSLLAPAMIAVAVSTVLVGDATIYRAQLRDRSRSPFHRVHFSFPMLSTLTVRQAMVDSTSADEQHSSKSFQKSPSQAVPSLQAEQTLDTALEQLLEAESGWALVAHGGEVVGRVTVRDILRLYRSKRLRSGI